MGERPRDRGVLARQLKRQRRKARLTQRDLAEVANLSPEFVSRIERGVTSPSLETFLRLCQSLSCTPNDLLLPDATDVVANFGDRLRGSDPETARRAIHAAEAILAYSGDD
ncbi:MAG: helix-turn-helix transcriptional regulator [Deltaproteobacteria bacterium]|nr:helix-turn-helix transcriptional regulator [Deltaproteobacteria bacterium]